jgi:aspartate/methionine/tyrosine aminotransferase
MAGSVGFMKHHLDMTAEELCKRLIEEESTFLVPGDCFEMSQYLRIGYGNSVDVLVEGLRNLKSFLDRNR